MALSGNTIIPPVEIKDVQKILGTTINDVGQLCRHNKINKWCLYKPVRYPSITETDRKKLGSGISVSNMADSPDNIAFAEPGNFLWIYQSPAGGINSPYRLTDFRGYYPYCRCPMKFSYPNVIYKDKTSHVSILLEDEYLPDANVKFSDIFKLSTYGNYRLSFAIVDKDATSYTVKGWFFAPRLDGLDVSMSYSDYLDIVIKINALEKFGILKNKTYTGVVMLTNYPSDGDFDTIANGVTAQQMTNSGANALALEPEKGANQFLFTYEESYIASIIRVWYLYFDFDFEKRRKFSSKAQADIYSLYNWIILVDKNTARIIGDGQHEIQIRARVISFHYQCDYYNSLLDLSETVYNKTYNLSPWTIGTEYIIDPGYDSDENEKYNIDLSFNLYHVNFNDENNQTGNAYGGIFFDSNGNSPIGVDDTVYEVQFYAVIRERNNIYSEVRLANESVNVKAGNNYSYSNNFD